MDKVSTILPLEGSGLSVARDGRVLLDVDHVKLGKQGVTCILGHNGAGKSLLLKVLSGLVKPDQGLIRWNGASVERADYKKLGYMKQNAVLLRRSAKANLEFPLLSFGWSKQDASTKADAALEKAGLTHITHSSARVLSGGERQRLSLARMLIVSPQIAILDEPTASLDPESTAAIEQTIKSLSVTGVPVILVTHNLNQARRLANNIIFLHQGKILSQQSSLSFFNNPECEEAKKFISE